MANSKKKTYEAKAYIVNGETTTPTGDTLELTDLQAKHLLENDLVVLLDEPEEEVQEPEVVEPDAPEEPKKKKK